MFNDKLAVAMSGGVDSSVAAAFLKNRGYKVTGFTVKFYSGSDDYQFPSEVDINCAKKICGILDIPHILIDCQVEFQKKVIDYFVSEYLAARTPNPCVLCNKHIKFGILLEEAEKIGCSFLATGHYAVISRDKKTGKTRLCRGREHGKDQSYFLARIPLEIMSKILFPVGTFSKAKIRKLAKKFGLPVSDKKESQEVCFINNESISDFIRRYKNISLESGHIKNTAGETIGIHSGIAGYTIGQRKGLGVAVGKPVFVNRIDSRLNEIFVGEAEQLYKSSFLGTSVMWFQDIKSVHNLKVDTRIRYAHRPVTSKITLKNKNSIVVHFKKPQRAITPGQLAVFYQKDVVIGSAWIERVLD